MKMKTNRILASVALLAGLFSCTQKVEFHSVPFAAFDSVSVATEETDGVVEIPVTAYDFSSAFTVTFETEDGTATAGDFYTIVDNDTQILRFTPDAPTQIIKVGITDKSGTFTGNTTFKIKLATATNNVSLAGNTVCDVSIADKDHPLAAMLGTYAAQGNCAFGAALSYDLKVYADKDDVTKVWFDPISPFLLLNGMQADLQAYGIVSDEMKTITLPMGQNTVEVWGGAEDYMYLTSWAVEGGAPVIDDSVPELKFVWNDTAGGYVNDVKFCLGGRTTGKLGNYYYLYIPANGLMIKKK